MGAGSGTQGIPNSVTITNNGAKAIEITTIQDDSVAESNRTKKHTIASKEYLVLFTDRVVSLSWEKQGV